MIAAIAAICVSPGYAAASIADIVKAAGVSRNTFYDFFENTDQCLMVAFDDYYGQLFATIERAFADPGSRAQKVGLAVHAALAFFAADLPATQLLSGGILALGRPGAERYHAAIDDLAARLHAATPKSSLARPPDPAWSCIVIAAGALDKAAISADPNAVLALEDQLTELFLAVTSEAAS